MVSLDLFDVLFLFGGVVFSTDRPDVLSDPEGPFGLGFLFQTTKGLSFSKPAKECKERFFLFCGFVGG